MVEMDFVEAPIRPVYRFGGWDSSSPRALRKITLPIELRVSSWDAGLSAPMMILSIVIVVFTVWLVHSEAVDYLDHGFCSGKHGLRTGAPCWINIVLQLFLGVFFSAGFALWSWDLHRIARLCPTNEIGLRLSRTEFWHFKLTAPIPLSEISTVSIYRLSRSERALCLLSCKVPPQCAFRPLLQQSDHDFLVDLGLFTADIQRDRSIANFVDAICVLVPTPNAIASPPLMELIMRIDREADPELR